LYELKPPPKSPDCRAWALHDACEEVRVSFRHVGRVDPRCGDWTKVQFSVLLCRSPPSSLQGQMQGGASQTLSGVFIRLSQGSLAADHPCSSESMHISMVCSLYSSHTHSSLVTLFLFYYIFSPPTFIESSHPNLLTKPKKPPYNTTSVFWPLPSLRKLEVQGRSLTKWELVLCGFSALTKKRDQEQQQ